MSYSIGKIYDYNKKIGVGYIITENGKYMFTIDDLYGNKDDYNNGDIVKFKGEKVYDNTNKAFFIKKLVNKNNQLN